MPKEQVIEQVVEVENDQVENEQSTNDQAVENGDHNLLEEWELPSTQVLGVILDNLTVDVENAVVDIESVDDMNKRKADNITLSNDWLKEIIKDDNEESEIGVLCYSMTVD